MKMRLELIGISRSDLHLKGQSEMKLFIYGASGAGLEVYDLAFRQNKSSKRYSEILLIDDFQEEVDYYGTKRIHFSSCGKYMGEESVEFVIAVGEPSARKLLLERVTSAGYTLTTLIDESAIVSETAKISRGCVISAGAVVSSNVILEENCFVMFHSIIGHDAHVKGNCVICPKATVGGNSVVGEQCFIGLASSMKQEVKIGDKVIVGMGSMLFKDVEDGSTVLGNPARITKGNAEHKVFN